MNAMGNEMRRKWRLSVHGERAFRPSANGDLPGAEDEFPLHSVAGRQRFIDQVNDDAGGAAASRLAELQEEHRLDIDFLHNMHDEEAARVYPEIFELNRQVQALQEELDAARAERDQLQTVLNGDALCEICGMDLGACHHWGDLAEIGNHRFILGGTKAGNVTLTERAALALTQLNDIEVPLEGVVLARATLRDALAATSPAVEVDAPEGGGT